MKSYIKNIMAVGLSAIVVAGAIVPAEAAMPLPAAPKSVETAGNDASNNVVNVQYWRDRGGRGDWGDRRGWYGGHRGYRDYRQAIVIMTATGSRSQPLRRVRSSVALSRSHVKSIARFRNIVRVPCIANTAQSAVGV